ncbi:uncharacterized protein [Dermacentor andersoni]|uniref:uncharacterized protein n=1 Tax=Dermacentor andersoni TaxID=34620 RepID=UPI003B3B1FD8
MESASPDATAMQDYDEHGNPQHGQDYGQQKKDLPAPQPYTSLPVIFGVAVAVTALTAVLAFYAMQTARREETTTTTTTVAQPPRYFGVTPPSTITVSTPISDTNANSTDIPSKNASTVVRMDYEGSNADDDEEQGGIADATTTAHETMSTE